VCLLQVVLHRQPDGPAVLPHLVVKAVQHLDEIYRCDGGVGVLGGSGETTFLGLNGGFEPLSSHCEDGEGDWQRRQENKCELPREPKCNPERCDRGHDVACEVAKDLGGGRLEFAGLSV